MALAADAALRARVALVRRDASLSAVLMLMVVPVHETADPFASRGAVREAADRIRWTVYADPEYRCGAGFIVAYPGTAVGWRDAQSFASASRAAPFLRAAVVGMQDQWLIDTAFGQTVRQSS